MASGVIAIAYETVTSPEGAILYQTSPPPGGPFLSTAHMSGSLTSLVLIMIIAQMPIGIHMMKTSIGQIAIELEHSSRVCGAVSESSTTRRYVAPRTAACSTSHSRSLR